MGIGLMSSYGGLGLMGGTLGVLFGIGMLVVVLVGVWLWCRFSAASAQRRMLPLIARPYTAREILLERYLRGELSRPEFQRMWHDQS